MDLFQKTQDFTLANEYREQGIYPYFHALESRQDVEVMMEGKRRIMLGSNNYLGLTTNEEVIEAGRKALEQYGTGCSGSRFLNGTLVMHLELEKELAEFLRKEAEELALLYIVRDRLLDVEPKERGYSFAADDDSTPFKAAASKVPASALIDIMDEHMSCVEVMFPKEYRAVL